METNHGKLPMIIQESDLSTQHSDFYDPGEDYSTHLQHPPKFQKLSIQTPATGNNNNASISATKNNAYTSDDMQDQEIPTNCTAYPQQSEDKDLFQIYQEEHVQEGISLCKNSLLGKILAMKLIPKQALQSSLMGIYCKPSGLKITELGNNMYQFNLEKEVDVQRILKGPWIVRNA